jgi:hypothetical protein
LVTLSAFSLPSFAGGIAGVASGLPLGFKDGFPRLALSEFLIAGFLLGFQRSIAGLLLGFQRGLASGSLGGLRRS